MRWHDNLTYIISRAQYGNSVLSVHQIEQIIEDDGKTRPEDAMKRWRPCNPVTGVETPLSAVETTNA